MEYYLAIDIGASSGRHIVGWSDNGKMMTEEVYRFPNGIERKDGHAFWNIDGIFGEVKKGIKVALEKYDIRSMAIDTWGVDYVLLRGGKASPCFSYRDDRTEATVKSVHAAVPFEDMYARTGIQFQTFNTVYQLYDDLEHGRLDGVTDFLMIPEYLDYLLTGVKKKEYTNATTTGLISATDGGWDFKTIDALSLPRKLFCDVCRPGTVVGELSDDVAKEVGGQMKVVLCASHDTASAVEAIPIPLDTPYVSSGTWSLLGIKSAKARCDEKSRKANYSNEGGVGYVRYQKNIMGLWVVQQLRKELCPDKSFAIIADEAKNSAFDGVVDIDDRCFLSPVSMVAAFDNAFDGKAQKPKSVTDYFRCAFTSLAFGYKRALAELKDNTGLKFDALHIVGGGAKNTYLNKLIEQIAKIDVVPYPIEATALGNLKIQAEANI